jgi:hypothetical protein
MKNLKVITIIAIFLIVGSAINVLAQGRSSRTGSAKAAYGYPDTEYKSAKKKKKKKKQRKAKKSKPKKGKQPLYRNKNPWAG